MQSAGFIGLGVLGSAVAPHLARAGRFVAVHGPVRGTVGYWASISPTTTVSTS